MNGVAFMETLLDVVSVVAQKDHTLLIVFENGEKCRSDMKPLLDKKPFSRLKNYSLFTKATVAHGTMVWPGNIDITPETLWDKSEPVWVEFWGHLTYFIPN
jgi:hypothetical protein